MAAEAGAAADIDAMIVVDDDGDAPPVPHGLPPSYSSATADGLRQHSQSRAAAAGSGAGIDASEPIEVHCRGTLLAALMHEMACSKTDCEGLLFGTVLEQKQVTVGDAREQTTTRSRAIVVESFTPLGGPLSFYSATGEVDARRLSEAAGDMGGFVGWYTFRRGTSLVPSYRERLVHKNLSALSGRRRHVAPIALAIFNCTYAANAATHTMEHCVAVPTANGRGFRNAQFKLGNLDHSMHDGYKVMPTTNFQSTKSPHTFDFSNLIGELPTVRSGGLRRNLHTSESAQIEDVFDKSMSTVRDLVDRVAETDAEVAALQRELVNLRKPSAPSPVATDIPAASAARPDHGAAAAAAARTSATMPFPDTNPFARCSEAESPPFAVPPSGPVGSSASTAAGGLEGGGMHRTLSVVVAEQLDVSRGQAR
eukprot:CAMPEP_0182947570 /NCGR_PEP_ID=MMETSP0105_2-20130417/58780_1 /TAXON_ID=81532 ORGANISM="Acanthoeca-like sp., Strain 10tr" /NCGR_SAMPLE_ID=MMETSP0105_2 /ASSEMBLY_ACC=CAM_ASM_000205 /LENGTH=423 /DNA_ID=CAMNT_0025087815 /DNA_START=16 /DNA_END=1284 /DNA_ORIENTATION=+